MFSDGVCRVTDRLFTKTIEFLDITYRLAQDEDQTTILNGWCGFLNYFDPSIRFQFVFVDASTSEERITDAIAIPPAGDHFDSDRAEYTQMLRSQWAKGRNGLRRAKYLSFGVEEKSVREARSRLERIETNLIGNFKKLGVVSWALDGRAYLEVLNDILNMGQRSPFRFSWDWLPLSGLSTKDFIAPSSFEFQTGRTFRMGKKYCKVSFLQILAAELEDHILEDFLDTELVKWFDKELVHKDYIPILSDIVIK